MARRRRSWFDKLLYSRVFRCSSCGRTKKTRRLFDRPGVRFVLATHTHCVRCGSVHVKRSRKRDHIDSVSRHPLSSLAALSGAPLVRCDACRLQYHDWRPIHPDAHQN